MKHVKPIWLELPEERQVALVSLYPKNIRIHNIMEAVDENFAAVSRENRYETNMSPKPLELDLTEKFWSNFRLKFICFFTIFH